MTEMIETDELKKVVAENLGRLRESRGWSQDDLAQKVGVHRVHISRCENGHSLPSTELLFMLADAFGVSADSLRQIPVHAS